MAGRKTAKQADLLEEAGIEMERRLPQDGHVPVPGLRKGLAGLGRRKPAGNSGGYPEAPLTSGSSRNAPPVRGVFRGCSVEG